jgi:hypothetical protein
MVQAALQGGAEVDFVRFRQRDVLQQEVEAGSNQLELVGYLQNSPKPRRYPDSLAEHRRLQLAGGWGGRGRDAGCRRSVKNPTITRTAPSKTSSSHIESTAGLIPRV